MTPADAYVIHRIATGEKHPFASALRVGRRDDCEIKLTDSDASRLHARLTIEDDCPWVEDLNSSNGTFVNDERIVGKRRLEISDKLRFVDERFELLLDSAAGKPRAWVPPTKAGTVGIEEYRKKQQQDARATQEVVAAVQQPCFVVLGAEGPGRRIELVAAPGSEMKWTIGSDDDRAIILPDASVSGFHATLSTDGRRWKIVDEMSLNGVVVNNEPVTIRYLNHGDRIGLGPIQCLILLPGGNAAVGESAAGSATEGRRWVLIMIIVVAVAAAGVLLARLLHLPR